MHNPLFYHWSYVKLHLQDQNIDILQNASTRVRLIDLFAYEIQACNRCLRAEFLVSASKLYTHTI